MNVRFVLAAVALFLLPSFRCAADPDIASFQVREGTLITNRATPNVFVFRSGGTDEQMVYDPARFLTAKTKDFDFDVLPGLTHLEGFRTPHGIDLHPEDKKLVELLPKEGREDSLVFKGVDGKLFYLPKDGKTLVIRVDLVLQNGRKVTFWKRRE